MYPEICRIGPFSVYSYGVMLVAAFIAGSALACRRAKKEGIDPDAVFDFVFICFIGGVLGARLFYVITNLGFYISNPVKIFMLQEGGLSWFGGLALGASCGFVYLKAKKLAVYKILDLVVPYLALAQAIGRIGCLLNGCCFGESLIPAQVYASSALLAIFFILRAAQDRPHWQGKIFFLYLLLYSFKRFFIEFIRVDNPAVYWGLTLFQIISAAIFCAALIKLILCRNMR